MSLLKSFIKSAVNQVGRDTGKVVSNSIYGDKHSTPIRNVGNNTVSFSGQNSNDNYFIRKKNYTLWYIIFGVFIMFIPILGLIYLIGNIVKYLSIKNSIVYTYEKEPIYKKDLRHRSGNKLVGYQNVKKEFFIPLENKDKISNVVISVTYILFAIFNLIFTINLFSKIYLK